MELVHQLLGMFEVGRQFPTCAYVAVSRPLDEVVELPIVRGVLYQ